jgi:anti-sigma-K factor RskA
MNDEDLDALAAEYVLGTLASDERAHAEALIAIDPGFVEIVRQWERRLGELNVMVEAVEPPAEVWDKIKARLVKVAPDNAVGLAPSIAPTPPVPAAKAEPEAAAEDATEAESETETETEAEQSPLLSALESDLLSPHGKAEGEPDESRERPAAEFVLQPPAPLVPPSLERGADIFYLSHRMRRWRSMALASGALAAVLAAFIVLTQVEPGLIPAGVIRIPQLFAQSGSPAASPAPAGSRLVAVLQQAPSSPAFLLTVDPASRTLTVRRVSAKAETGHSYELWLIAPRADKPLSLGLVGAVEYTQRPLPTDFDADAMRAATFAVSFEPAGGSKTGAPTGPILFTGKLVESVAPPAPPTPKT